MNNIIQTVEQDNITIKQSLNIHVFKYLVILTKSLKLIEQGGAKKSKLILASPRGARKNSCPTPTPPL